MYYELSFFVKIFGFCVLFLYWSSYPVEKVPTMSLTNLVDVLKKIKPILHLESSPVLGTTLSFAFESVRFVSESHLREKAVLPYKSWIKQAAFAAHPPLLNPSQTLLGRALQLNICATVSSAEFISNVMSVPALFVLRQW